jgi:hypothetical protein
MVGGVAAGIRAALVLDESVIVGCCSVIPPFGFNENNTTAAQKTQRDPPCAVKAPLSHCEGENRRHQADAHASQNYYG